MGAKPNTDVVTNAVKKVAKAGGKEIRKLKSHKIDVDRDGLLG